MTVDHLWVWGLGFGSVEITTRLLNQDSRYLSTHAWIKHTLCNMPTQLVLILYLSGTKNIRSQGTGDKKFPVEMTSKEAR